MQPRSRRWRRSTRVASQAMIAARAHAATDMTGFGLLGHAGKWRAPATCACAFRLAAYRSSIWCATWSPSASRRAVRVPTRASTRRSPNLPPSVERRMRLISQRRADLRRLTDRPRAEERGRVACGLRAAGLTAARIGKSSRGKALRSIPEVCLARRSVRARAPQPLHRKLRAFEFEPFEFVRRESLRQDCVESALSENAMGQFPAGGSRSARLHVPGEGRGNGCVVCESATHRENFDGGYGENRFDPDPAGHVVFDSLPRGGARRVAIADCLTTGRQQRENLSEILALAPGSNLRKYLFENLDRALVTGLVPLRRSPR